ncbi:hypothetical protein [Albibacterium profundi]|uniref:Uncharacterized protein n=1 Tax=Albibacterium profundi TaxID=3134906 RepID=A0ABV5CHJ6_9SPHI
MLKVVKDLNKLIKAEDRPFAVIIAKLSIKHISDTFMNDYFIIRKNKNWINDKDYEVMNMDSVSIRFFRRNMHLFTLALDNHEGKVYELKNNPFKSLKTIENGKSKFSRSSAIEPKSGILGR